MEPASTVPRKRLGRPPKNAAITQQQPSAQIDLPFDDPNLPTHSTQSKTKPEEIYTNLEMLEDTESSPLFHTSLNTTDEFQSADAAANISGGSATTSAECRRSSRKKVIKFDVRDLLNKNRKPHKIQIEARIDSNAPTPPKPTAPQVAVGLNTSGTTATGTVDLTIKQKTFIEKSAIFRRFSISEQQKSMSVVGQLRPSITSSYSEASPKLSLMDKTVNSSVEDIDAAIRAADQEKAAQTRRLSRTQEIFNASMLKSKQNSSLIVAQMESSSSGSTISSGKGSLVYAATKQTMQQKKAANSRKKTAATLNSSSNSSPEAKSAEIKLTEGTAPIQKKRGRPPKVKTCVPTQKTEILDTTDSLTAVKNIKIDVKSAQEFSKKQINVETSLPCSNVTSPSTKQLVSATNWQEYKSLMQETDNNAETIATKSFESGADSAKMQDIVLEISSDAELQQGSSELLTEEGNNAATKQRNFAAVSFLADGSLDGAYVTSAPEFIVAAVEEIITESPKNSTSTDDSNTKTDNLHASPQRDEFETATQSCSTEHSVEVIIKDSPSLASRTVSSSESETSSSERSSERSGNSKPYRKGDKLRVNVKRLSINSTNAALTAVLSLSSSSSSSGCSTINFGQGKVQRKPEIKEEKDEKPPNMKSDEERRNLSNEFEKRTEGIKLEDNENLTQVETHDANKEQVKSVNIEQPNTKDTEEFPVVKLEVVTTTENICSIAETPTQQIAKEIPVKEKVIKEPEDIEIREQSIAVEEALKKFVKTQETKRLQVEAPKDGNTSAEELTLLQQTNTESLEQIIEAEENMVEFSENVVEMPECIVEMPANTVELPEASADCVLEVENVETMIIEKSKLEEATNVHATETIEPEAAKFPEKFKEPSTQCKREVFTLPLKKQVSKLQIYQMDVAETEKSMPAQLEVQDDINNSPSENVDNALLLSTVQDDVEETPTVEIETSVYLEVLPEAQTIPLLDNIPETNTTPDLCALESPLTQLPKKIKRRYERRSVKEEESAPKMLEETIAKITEDSSKEILHSAALESDFLKECVTTPLPEPQELKELNEASALIEEPAIPVPVPVSEIPMPEEKLFSEESDKVKSPIMPIASVETNANDETLLSVAEIKPEDKPAPTVEVEEPIKAIATNEREDRTPRAPPKKRLSKMQAESEAKEAISSILEPEEISIAAEISTNKSENEDSSTAKPSSHSSKEKHKLKKSTVDKSSHGIEEKETDKPLARKIDKKTEESGIVEKSAKKKRQKRLKEAFEAALRDEAEAEQLESELLMENVEINDINEVTPIPMPPVATAATAATATATTAEIEIDPLKDIEKFIEAGVNLLKRGYKTEDDDVCTEVEIKMKPADPNPPTPTSEIDSAFKAENDTNEIETALVLDKPTSETIIAANDFKAESNELQAALMSFETPADTPIATPTASPPPKSPPQEDSADETALRRSHRLKKITRAPKALVGRGLVRDKERISMKDDVETKSHYSLDDHLMDLAEVEAKNAKFLKDMEERLSNFQVIKENEYKCERVISKEAKKMLCDCFLTTEEEGRGELGCGEDCLNRLLMIECGLGCNVKDRCTNKRFQKFLCSPCRVFRTEKKGFGIMADIEILPGEFIMEYVGEVIDGDEFEQRRMSYSQEKNRHYYFMALRSDAIIDATIKGNISRFINHSCDPNAETQKWTVNGELRIGFFSRKSIMPGEEITFDYQYQRYGREAQRCYCESANCRGWIGEEPNSDEGEQLDEVDSDEDNLAASLLDDDDEDDSDESVDDAEEVQKKLEIAAAEAKLGDISAKGKSESAKEKRKKTGAPEEDKKETEKLKKLLSKVAEKVAAKKKKQKQKAEEKKQRKRNVLSANDISPSKARYLEDPDIEDEVHFLSRCGLKNQLDTLRLSRLIVRAKLVQTRLDLLDILRKGELPCRRLFLDYHGLRLLHGWMSEDGGDMNTRMALLQTLECLPIANKTVLTDSKVYQLVQSWCGAGTTLSPSDESSKESASSNSQQAVTPSTSTSSAETVPSELQKLGSKLMSNWDSLPEIFRIPKRERIEQMKEHEREADRQYAAAADEEDNSRLSGTDRYQRDRFGRSFSNRFVKPHNSKDARSINTIVSTSCDMRRRVGAAATESAAAPKPAGHLSKEQRREMFAAKVARDEAEKRLAEERREFETKCRFFGLDPKRTRPQDMPFLVNPATGQWYSVERQPIPTPLSYAHVQVVNKPKSTDPADYELPAAAKTLPPQWKYSITPQGKIYYYHVQKRVPQWEPPTAAQCSEAKYSNAAKSDSESDETDASDETMEIDDDVLLNMDAAKLKAFIEKKVEMRRQQRYARLVDERSISPRREEDRIYNQLEVRKYKENKEKIRKRKEEIRRRRAQGLRLSAADEKQQDPNISTGSLTAGNETTASGKPEGNGSDDDKLASALPIQDYLLSSDEEDIIKAECNNSPLLEKIVQGDKIVDELDALTTKRTLKRVLPPHREPPSLATTASSSGVASGTSASTSSAALIEKQEHKKRKLDKREKSKKSKDYDTKYRKLKEKFRCEIAGIIVAHLKPYRKDSCQIGRIQNDEDFNHLARKLTHFVMIKELKYCESVGQTLVVTESVKNKSREFIKKYMAKYGDVYEKPKNDPEFKDIPFRI